MLDMIPILEMVKTFVEMRTYQLLVDLKSAMVAVDSCDVF
jgi:hypothetical protein